jgi:hypothetical protein
MSHKKKEWTLKELEEKKQRFLKRHADLNPESVRNRKYPCNWAPRTSFMDYLSW